MNGRLATALLIVPVVFLGLLLWYLQHFKQYRPIELDQVSGSLFGADGMGSAIELADLRTGSFRGIQGDASPLKFRACFEIRTGVERFTGNLDIHEDPIPLIAPSWFDCFDARAIGHDLESGQATAVLIEADIADGVDRVAAIYPDGRTVVWHQLNEKYAN